MIKSPASAARRTPQIMGVLNLAPDSASGAGQSLDPGLARDRALRLLAEGAAIISIGGQSNRPSAARIEAREEIRRVAPVIEAIRKQSDCAICIDTMKPETARAAFGAGADIWNDVTALRFAPDSLKTAGALNAYVILMHAYDKPKAPQSDPLYPRGVTAEVLEFFAQRELAAQEAGVSRDKLMIDPGLGFGKTARHDLTLLADTARLVEFGLPVAIGASRKRFIERMDDATDASERLGGSIAAAIWAAAQGTRILRAHDVRATAQALRIWAAIGAAD